MENFYHYQDKTKRLSTKRTDFKLTDEKGRKVGFRTVIKTVDSAYVFETKEALTAHIDTTKKDGISPGFSYRILPFQSAHYYKVDTHALRDGETFGALTRTLYAETLGEAHKLAKKRFDGAKARYSKKYGA